MQALGSRPRQQVMARSSSVGPQRSVVGRVAVPRPGLPVVVAQGLKSRSTGLVVSASAVAPRSNEEGASEQQGSGFSPLMGVPASASLGNVTMAGGPGGSATLERGKFNFVMPTPVVKGPKLDDGGDGGDIGKINRNGGGGGGGGDDDDDDYFNGEDGDGDGDGEGQGGHGFFRTAIPESYDKFSIGAVLSEWMKTIQELPAILRQAVTMGLFSSAQLVRFFAMDVRPSVTRAISRRLPPSLARDFVGRLMADPGFVQKLVLESMIASGASLWYEYRLRGDKFKQEADLALINSLGMAVATAATVWLLAPSRSYGSIQKFPWQQMLDNLPNCVFDANGPLRNYSNQARAAGFLAKMAELSAVGALTGTLTSVLSSAAVAVRQRNDPDWQPSTPVPSIGRSSGGLAAFFALNANTRYQLIGGLDQFLFSRTSFLWTYVMLSGGARLASNQVGEISRPWWQGLPAPATLVRHEPAVPVPRKIRKKVSKRVPRSQLAAAVAASTPAAAAGAAAMDQLDGGVVGQPAAQPAMLLDTAVPLQTAAPVAPQGQDSTSGGVALQGVQQVPVVASGPVLASEDTTTYVAATQASVQPAQQPALSSSQAVGGYSNEQSEEGSSEAESSEEAQPQPVAARQ